jgi:hypothetical protein
MNTKQQASLINIQNQVKELIGVDVEVYLETEKMDQSFGVPIRFRSGKYSPSITRYYWHEIEKVNEKDLLNAYAMAFNKIPSNLIDYKSEPTNFTVVEEEEGEFTLSPDYWYEQPSQRRGVKVEGILGQFTWVCVNSSTAYFFKPDKEVKIKVTKDLVWGCQTDDDWEFYSSWRRDDEIDQNYSEWNDTTHHYAKQEEIWKAEIIS